MTTATTTSMNLGKGGGGTPPLTAVTSSSFDSPAAAAATALTGLAVRKTCSEMSSSPVLRRSWSPFWFPAALCVSLSGCALGLYYWYSTTRRESEEVERDQKKQERQRITTERYGTGGGCDGHEAEKERDVSVGRSNSLEGESRERQLLERKNDFDDGGHTDGNEQEGEEGEQDLEDLETSDEERAEARDVTRGVYVQPTHRVKQLKRRGNREGRRKDGHGEDTSRFSNIQTKRPSSGSGDQDLLQDKTEITEEEEFLEEELSDRMKPTSDESMLFLPGRQKIFVKTFGCAHNQSDSEYMMGLLDAAGYVFVDSLDEADLCLINSCTVKSPSEFALYSVIQQALQIEVPTASAVRAGHRGCSEVSPVTPAYESPHGGSKKSSSSSSQEASPSGPLSPKPVLPSSPHHPSPNTTLDSPTSTPVQSPTPLSEKTTEASECGGGERDQRNPLDTMASLEEDSSVPILPHPSREECTQVESDVPEGVAAEVRNKQQKKTTEGERRHDEDKGESSHLVSEKEECECNGQVSTASCGGSCCCSSSSGCKPPSPKPGSKDSEEGGEEDEETAGGENKKSSEEQGCGEADEKGSSCCCDSSPCSTGVANSPSTCGGHIKKKYGKDKKGVKEDERMKEAKKVSIVLKQRRTKPIPCVVAGCVPHAAGESNTSEKRSKKNVVSGDKKIVEELDVDAGHDGDVNREGEEKGKTKKKGASRGGSKAVKGEVEKKGGETSEQRDLLNRCSIVGVHAIDRIVEVVEEALKGNVVRLTGKRKLPSLDLPKIRRNALIEIVPISTGCLGSCTYCKTKHARGELGSYSEDAIEKRVRSALAEGVKQIWLTSEDSGAYGLDCGSSLTSLLTRLAKVVLEPQGDQSLMLRVGMSNPPFLLQQLNKAVEVFKHPNVFEFLHLPLQSGSNDVLTAMNREYTAQQFEYVVETLLSHFPHMTIATDIICGFPGETEEDHQQTLDLLKRWKFPVVNISQFYPRPGTPAASMKQLPSQIVKRRSREVTALFESYTCHDWMLHTTQMVWFTATSDRSNHTVGQTRQYVKVLTARDDALLGRCCLMYITATEKWHVVAVRAEPVQPAAALRPALRGTLEE